MKTLRSASGTRSNHTRPADPASRPAATCPTGPGGTAAWAGRRRAGVCGILALAALLLPFLTSPATAAGTWNVFLYGNEVRRLAARGDEIWAGTSGGLVRLRPDGTMSQWNRAEQELLSDSVSAVAVDADQRVWAGTETAGISVFEPGSFLWTPFTSLLQPIPGDRIHCVRFAGASPAETLLVGAVQGYAVLVNGELRRTCQEGIDICGLPSYDVRDLLAVGGEIWIGTAGGVVAQRADGGWSPRNTGLGTAIPKRFARADSLYLATSTGARGAIWAWRNGHWGLAGDAALPSWFVPEDLLAAGDTLYAGGAGGVYQRVQGVWSPAGDISSWAPAPGDTVTINALARTPSGRLYAGAADEQERRDGIWERRGGRWEQHRIDGPSLLASYKAIAFDADATLWISSARRRVSPLITRYRDGSWTLFRGNEGGRSNAWTLRMLQTGSGVWLAHCCGAKEQADSFHMERLRAGDRFQAWPIVNAFDLSEDGQGRLWVATSGLEATDALGLYRVDPADSTWIQVQVSTPGAALQSDLLTAVASVGNKVWIGYPDQGVSRWDLGADGRPLTADDTWVQFTETLQGNPLIGNKVKRIAPGLDGRVWIGTTAGLSIFEDPKFVNIGAGFGRLPAAEINDIVPLPDGGAYVATQGGGFTRLTPRTLGGFTYATYGPPDLPNPNIEAMTLAPDGRTLWMATDRGIASYLPASATGAATASNLGAYPNPYNPACVDGVRMVGAGSQVRGIIVDLSGKTIAEFPADGRGTQDAGLPVWDGRDHGRSAAPGLYWIRVQTAGGIRSVGVAVIDGACAR